MAADLTRDRRVHRSPFLQCSVSGLVPQNLASDLCSRQQAANGQQGLAGSLNSGTSLAVVVDSALSAVHAVTPGQHEQAVLCSTGACDVCCRDRVRAEVF